jgi:DNA-binding SARP family transcriptional activator
MQGPEVLAHGVTAVLAVWLGLLVMARSPRLPAARVFGVLASLLATWSVAILLQAWTSDPVLRDPARSWVNGLEDIAAFLLPAATLHIAVVIAAEGRLRAVQRFALLMAYGVGIFAGAQAFLDPGNPIVVNDEGLGQLTLFGIPESGPILGWAFIGVRAAIFAAALAWLLGALRHASADAARQRQLEVTLATVALGVLGGTLRMLPEPFSGPPAVGLLLIAVAMVLATYAVFSSGLFLSVEVAGQAFRRSILGGLAVVAYIGLLVGLEELTQSAFDIELPLVTGLALVATIALFEPVSERVRGLTGKPASREAGRERLLRALGGSIITSQAPEHAIQPALARLCRIFRLSGAQVTDADGSPIVSHGASVGHDPHDLRLALQVDGRQMGFVTFGAKHSKLPFTPDEMQLLEMAASYLAASLSLAERHDEQIDALSDLSAEQARVETRGSVLSDALIRADTRTEALRVFALGPLRAERGLQPVRSWGGPKAGARQAEAIFAFLLDRGERGAGKDEIVELIWPDVDLERADLAFHRTLGGLRRTLEPLRGRRGGSSVIDFHNDRYRLDPGVIAWTDVAAFEELIARAGAETDFAVSLRSLEQARALYRGDYLDDCPFYGDSVHVEERRDLLRGSYLDLLVALGERYEQRGDRTAAASCFRQARITAGDTFAPAEQALARLGAV